MQRWEKASWKTCRFSAGAQRLPFSAVLPEGETRCRFPTAHGAGFLENLPVFRWADFPVSLLSFVSSGSALRLVGLRPPRRRLRVTLLPLLAPQDAAFQAAGGRRSMARHGARLRRLGKGNVESYGEVTPVSSRGGRLTSKGASGRAFPAHITSSGGECCVLIGSADPRFPFLATRTAASSCSHPLIYGPPSASLPYPSLLHPFPNAPLAQGSSPEAARLNAQRRSGKPAPEAPLCSPAALML